MTRFLAPSARPDGLGQGALYRPVVMRQTQVQHVHLYAKFSRPLGYGQRLAVECQIAVIALIARLFRDCGPMTIARLIVTVVVDAVNGVRRCGPRPHIFIERREGISPSLADRNPTAAVTRPVSPPGILAARNHVSPYLVFGELGIAVNRIARGLATAICRSAVAKVSTNNGPFLAARATAEPHRLAARVVTYVANNRPAAPLLAGHVVSHVFGYGYNLLSHVRTSSTNVMRGLRGVRSALQSPLFYHNRVYGQLGQGPRIQPYLH